MINVLPVSSDFIYTIKKALNTGIFNDPTAISDFIDYLDSSLRNEFGLDAIKSFNFMDGDYEITVILDTKEKSMEEILDSVKKVVIDTVMNFLIVYKNKIDTILQSIGTKEDIRTFDDCLASGQGNLLSEIVHITEFNTDNGYCVILRLY